jgi:hypothetical protein
LVRVYEDAFVVVCDPVDDGTGRWGGILPDALNVAAKVMSVLVLVSKIKVTCP